MANIVIEPQTIQYDNGRGALTPWGSANTRYKYNAWVSFYSCPGHGGFKVNKPANQRIPAPLRNEDGWYEEDCESYIPLFFFGLDSDSDRMRNGIKQWFPHQWEAFSGEKVSAEESNVIAREEFQEAHRVDWVTLAAWGSWADWVPDGMVGVNASRGGTRNRDQEERYFLIPKDEYDTRSQFGFVVDVNRHQEVKRTI